MTAASHGQRFELELERVRLRAMLAVEQSEDHPDAKVLSRVQGELAEVSERLQPLRQAGGPAERLARVLGLDADEQELLWVAVAAACDPRLLPHLQVLGGPDARRGLSLSTHVIVAGLDFGAGRRLSAALCGPHPLLRHHLIAVASEGQSPAARALAAAPRLCTWLAGRDDLDPALHGSAELVVVPEGRELDERQLAVADRLRQVLSSPDQPLVVIEGPVGSGRKTAVAAVLAEQGRSVMALDVRRLPGEAAALLAALRGLHRESLLRESVALCADVDELGSGDEGPGPLRALARALDEMPGPVVVTSSRAGLELPVRRPILRLPYTIPETATRRALWVRALGPTAGDGAADLDLLAMRYRLGAGGVGRTVASARLLAGGAPLTTPHLVAGVRSNIAERLGDLARRLEVRQSWDDLVLAPDLLDQARALVARVRHAHRVLEDWGFAAKLPLGVGVAALFSGPPGTGKTMLAGLIARELDLELYQVDLSKVVSKWVGETEKQLGRIFEAADAGHALLLFDEADALFARRTEVRSSNDRYANLEVNYLLQRIESFGGLTILTTNLEASIDPALRRRLACHIAFWPPDAAERELLWRRLIATRAPLDPGIDFRRLADKYAEMTGANVRNAVLSAAFLAAAEGSSITQQILERAARGEYLAMGRVLRGTTE